MGSFGLPSVVVLTYIHTALFQHDVIDAAKRELGWTIQTIEYAHVGAVLSTLPPSPSLCVRVAVCRCQVRVGEAATRCQFPEPCPTQESSKEFRSARTVGAVCKTQTITVP